MAIRGLSVSGVVNVQVNISPIAAGRRNFGTALVLGPSNIIDTEERVRSYRTLEQVADEFGTTAPEYLAASIYFSQQPRPNIFYVGKWAQLGTNGSLHGGSLTAEEQDIGDWNLITAGKLTIPINGTPFTTAGSINLAGETNLNGVAAAITAVLTGAVVTWDSVYERFNARSTTTGATSTIGYATVPGSGTDLGPLLKLTAATGASAPVPGIAAETPVAAALAAADRSGEWYGIHFAAATMPTDNDLIDVAAFIEGSERERMFAHTIRVANTKDPLTTNDLGSRLMALRYKRSHVAYSSTNAYAALSAIGRGYSVDFEAADTTLTLKFKQLPGVIAETITQSQAATLKAKNVNVFVNYDNGTAIYQEGVQSNGYYFDEVHGSDWAANAVKTAIWNLLYQTPTKVDQTDAGIEKLKAAAASACHRAVRNGLVRPGIWGGPDMGPLRTGDALPGGFLVWAPSVADQAVEDREARRAPTLQIALKFAGAVHFADVIMNFNR